LRVRAAALTRLGLAPPLGILRVRPFRVRRPSPFLVEGFRRRSTFLTRRNNSISLHCLHIKQVTELFAFYPRIEAQSLLPNRQFPMKKCLAG
jgi:hypothetical protein